ncbi:MAG TPA: hypothetical protein P5092_05000 [Ruminococcus sp.]|nr:hypothetical protein [Ruminococcus sp.]
MFYGLKLVDINQPFNGYLAADFFVHQQYSINKINKIKPSEYSSTVKDFVTHFTKLLMGCSAKETFNDCLIGSSIRDLCFNINKTDLTEECINNINGLNEESINLAYLLFKNVSAYYNMLKCIFFSKQRAILLSQMSSPDTNTHSNSKSIIQSSFLSTDEIEKIRLLVNRNVKFFKSHSNNIITNLSFEPENYTDEEKNYFINGISNQFGGYTQKQNNQSEFQQEMNFIRNLPSYQRLEKENAVNPIFTSYSNSIRFNTDDLLISKNCMWLLTYYTAKTIGAKSGFNDYLALKMLVYWIMGQKSGKEIYKNITSIGCYNPILDESYSLPITIISEETIKRVEKEVIGYEEA